MAPLRLAAPLLMLAFCNENRAQPAPKASAGPPSASAPAPLPPAEAAKAIARSRCAMCHGHAGTGDGPTAATMSPKPRDLTDPVWQKTVTDAEIRNAILGGGPAVGKSSLMPPNPDLKDQPAVVDALVQIVRAYRKPS
jgi:hypothetical protein